MTINKFEELCTTPCSGCRNSICIACEKTLGRYHNIDNCVVLFSLLTSFFLEALSELFPEFNRQDSAESQAPVIEGILFFCFLHLFFVIPLSFPFLPLPLFSLCPFSFPLASTPFPCDSFLLSPSYSFLSLPPALNPPFPLLSLCSLFPCSFIFPPCAP